MSDVATSLRTNRSRGAPSIPQNISGMAAMKLEKPLGKALRRSRANASIADLSAAIGKYLIILAKRSTSENRETSAARNVAALK